MLAVSALSGAYPRLLVDRVPGQGTAPLPERRPAGRAVNYRPAVPEVRRYLARESAKFIARSREWYVIMPLYSTYLPTSSSRNRDKITGETPLYRPCSRSTQQPTVCHRFASFCWRVRYLSFYSLIYASDTRKFYSFEEIRDCRWIIYERSLLISGLRVSS